MTLPVFCIELASVLACVAARYEAGVGGFGFGLTAGDGFVFTLGTCLMAVTVPTAEEEEAARASLLAALVPEEVDEGFGAEKFRKDPPQLEQVTACLKLIAWQFGHGVSLCSCKDGASLSADILRLFHLTILVFLLCLHCYQLL